MRWPRGQNELPLTSSDAVVEVGKEPWHTLKQKRRPYVLKGIKQRVLGGWSFVGFGWVFFPFGEGKEKRCLLSDTCCCHHTQAGFRS